VSVWVDDMEAPFGRMIMCHMVADSRQELDEMADKIGVARKWIQKPNTDREHYDICKAARRKEVIDVIEDWNLGFNLGNAVKYIARAKHKGTQLIDLEKAKWYLTREIQRLQKIEKAVSKRAGKATSTQS
jgi:hypothetical protein